MFHLTRIHDLFNVFWWLHLGNKTVVFWFILYFRRKDSDFFLHSHVNTVLYYICLRWYKRNRKKRSHLPPSSLLLFFFITRNACICTTEMLKIYNRKYILLYVQNMCQGFEERYVRAMHSKLANICIVWYCINK